MGVTGSGDADTAELCIWHLKQEFPQMSPTENTFRDKIAKVFLRLHKKYNLDAREYIGQDANRFNPTLLIGSKNQDNSFGLYLLKNNVMVYPKNEYEVLGSGGNLARLVIKQLNRSLAVTNLSLHKLSVQHAALWCSYIINEVKESDSQSGGQTRLIVINSDGVRELSPDEVQQIYNTFLGVMAEGFAPIFKGEISEEQIKEIWPKGD